jgi:hypothetical protein
MTVNPVSVTDVASALVGCVGGATSVLTLKGVEEVDPAELVEVTTTLYDVEGSSPVNTADLEETPLSMEGVTETSFKAYV